MTMKPLIFLLFSLTVLTCRVANPANQFAREMYPRFEDLSEAEHNFEQLWHLFDQHYAFFELKKIDWDAVYSKFRPMINSKTTEQELIAIFAQMLDPLQDGHVRLLRNGSNVIQLERRNFYFSTTFKGKLREFQSNTFKVLEAQGFAPVTKAIRTYDYEEQGLDYTYYYSQSKNFGYIRVVDCHNHLGLWDQILEKFHGTEGLIIDLRYNLGGEVGREMASRLIKEKKRYAFKIVKGPDGFSDPKSLRVRHRGFRYLKPVVVLINDACFSSAEDFALVLSKEEHVTTIGSNTGGYLSDVFNYRLPNGMNVWLSNEQYYTIDSVLLEDRGVSPSILMHNTLTDLAESRDPLINKAMELLRQKNNFE